MELWQRSALELAALVAKHEVSAREVIDEHLARIDAVNPAVNAVVNVLAEEARSAAKAADERQARGEALGPLHGVPITVKENIEMAGSPTTNGLPAFANAVPSADAPHVANMKAAGAIPIGRTNLPDFGLRWHTDNALRGATKNPWSASRTPGGSSGGEAAALATGMTALGMGNDYGGSLRVPANFCGVASIRPTLGRVPNHVTLMPTELPPTIQLMAVEGLLARRVADVRVGLEAISAASPRDPWWTPAPLRGPAPATPLRVALVAEPAGGTTEPPVAAAARRAAEALADAGYAVEETDPPDVVGAAKNWVDLVMADVRFLWSMIGPLASEDSRTFMANAMELIPPVDLDGYIATLAARNAHARAWSQFQADRPLVVGPVCTTLAFPVGADIAGREGTQAVLDSMRLTVIVNGLGLPAVAVPTGLDGGLPTGVQVIGPRYREDLCLDAAQAIEDRLGAITPLLTPRG
jgi:amidase